MKKTLLLSAALLTGALVASAGVAQPQQVKRMQPAVNNARPAMQMAASQKTATLKATDVVSVSKDVKMVKTQNGLYKKTLKHSRMGAKLNQRVNAFVAADDATLFEGFEGWDGAASDWVPEGWSSESKIEDQVAIALWGATNFSFYNYVYEGNAMMYVSNAIDIDMESFQMIAYPQDEWLYTPAVTPKAGDELCFMMMFDAGYALLNNDKLNYEGLFVYDAENTNLTVYVSEDDGANWTPLWNALDYVKAKYTVEEIDAMLMTFPWEGIRVDISDYVGKSVKFAFQYENENGSDVGLDNVMVGAPVPEVAYTDPGYLYFALTPDFMSYSSTVMIGPAYNDNVWESVANGYEADTYEWTYADPDDPSSELVSNDKNLTVSYPFTQIDYPVLTGTIAGNTSAPYSLDPDGFYQTGATPILSDGTNQYYGYASSYNLGTDDAFRLNGGPLAAPNSTSLGNIIGEDSKVRGIGTYMPQPAAPYSMTQVLVYLANDQITTDAEQLSLPITASVYKVNDGVIDLASPDYQATTTLADVVAVPLSGGVNYVLQFEFKEQVGSLTRNIEIDVDSPIYIEITADEKLLPDNCSISLWGGLSFSAPYYNVYYSYVDAAGNLNLDLYNNLVFAIDDGTEDGAPCYMNGIFIQTDATFGWVYEENGDYAFEAPAAGGEKTFTVNTFTASETWFVEGDEGLFDWYEVQPGEFDTATGNTQMKVIVDPLPSGTTLRSGKFSITANAAKKYFYIAQRDASGVSDIESSAVTVTVTDEGFTVANDAASAVEVYNIAGQKVAAAAIDGETTIPAAGLANGMYILKFNDNTVVKVVK